MRFTFASAFVASVFSLPAVCQCGLPKVSPNSESPTTFVYESGWAIPGLAGGSVVETRQTDEGSTEIRYKPAKNVEIDLQGFEVAADRKALRLMPGHTQLVTDILEYRIQNRAYAYSVVTVSLAGRPDPPMWRQVRPEGTMQLGTPTVAAKKGKASHMGAGVLGCGWTMLRYFDSDGDGRFESGIRWIWRPVGEFRSMSDDT